jgi:hypothetical protein
MPCRSVDSVKPPSGAIRPLRIISETALLGAGVTAAHCAGIPPTAMLYLSVSAAVCAITTGTVEIVSAVANRSPEARRMAALQRLARKASSGNERLSAAAILSLTTSTPRTERTETAEIILKVLNASSEAGISSCPEPGSTALSSHEDTVAPH